VATTLLASVVPCSEPDRAPCSPLPATAPACPGGAMFPSPAAGKGALCWDEPSAARHREHRSTLASSVVAWVRLRPPFLVVKHRWTETSSAVA
jgi:hypothetical protein